MGAPLAAAIAREAYNPYIRSGIMDRAETALETPCVNICLIDPGSRFCLGCGRTIVEIIGWNDMTEAERRAVMAALPARLQSLEHTKRPNV